MTLVDHDKPFLVALQQQANEMKSAFDSIKSAGFPSLDGTEVTKAVLMRMSAYAAAQNELKKLLNKRYAAPAADFFVETILFFLTLYCRSINPALEVHSERQVKPKRGQMRPDISVWLKDEVIAIIECKTQLGWNRGNWERDFQDRERRLNAEFPHAKAFLLVMTEGNWGGFANAQEKLGRQYFVLLRKEVNLLELDSNNVMGKIVNRIEELFSQIPLGHNSA